MAALPETAPRVPAPELADLRTISADDIDPLLREEAGAWKRALDWDFRKSAGLVRRFVELRALHGCALMENGQVSGYAYFVHEDHKGLIGDLYVREPLRSIENENRLLAAVLEALMSTAGVRRIESQLMMLAPARERSMPCSQFLSMYERTFMLASLAGGAALPAGRARNRIHLERWSSQHQETAAELITAAYASHIDSRINDQYRSLVGARRFLHNIVQYPGCGTFFNPASYVATEVATGRPCGIVLASLVGAAAGHITQICVAPFTRGTGAGYELLRQSLAALREHGCRTVSLTVTAANDDAIRLYERTGFHVARRFPAYVWEGWTG